MADTEGGNADTLDTDLLDGADDAQGEDVFEDDEGGEAGQGEEEGDTRSEADQGHGEAADAQPLRQQSRATRRVQAALEEARASKRETAELRERLDRIERQGTGQTAAQSQEQERQRLEAMDPDERREYQADQRFRRLEAELQATRFQSYDQTEKATFEARAARDPLAARYADRVEARLKEMRKENFNAARDKVLALLIGEDLLAKSGKAAAKQGKAGAARIAGQTTRAGQGRGDQASDRGKAGKSARDRLENVTF